MKSILYFVLLVVVCGSLSLFAVEQFEEKIESVHKNENVGVRKQDLLSSTNRKATSMLNKHRRLRAKE